MHKTSLLMAFLFLPGLLCSPKVLAQTWLEDSAHDFEEQRLQQLLAVQSHSNIASFVTDGCSGFQSQSWALMADTLPGFENQFGDKPPWENCCVAHDKLYWRGEVTNGYIKRIHADETLRQCIIETGVKLAPQFSLKYSLSEQQINRAFTSTADLMYQAVRLGGLPCSSLPWRWGYGWKNC